MQFENKTNLYVSVCTSKWFFRLNVLFGSEHLRVHISSSFGEIIETVQIGKSGSEAVLILSNVVCTFDFISKSVSCASDFISFGMQYVFYLVVPSPLPHSIFFVLFF
jgi:hypothetical protein